MASQTKICNIALRLLGASQIADISENTKAAELCNTLWDYNIKMLHEEHPWDFASEWTALAEVSGYTQDDDSWEYVYSLPSLCVTPMELLYNYDYEIRGEYLLTDDDEAVLHYTKLVTDTTKYPPKFTSALSYKLAADLAIPLAKSAAKAEQFLQLYFVTLNEAKTRNARQTKQDPEDAHGHTDTADTWLGAR